MKIRSLILATLLLFFITIEALVVFDFVFQAKQLRSNQIISFQTLIKLQSQATNIGLKHNFKQGKTHPNKEAYIQDAVNNYQHALTHIDAFENNAAARLTGLSLPKTRQLLNTYNEHVNLYQEQNSNIQLLDEIEQLGLLIGKQSHTEIELVAEQLSINLESQYSSLLFASVRNSLIVLFCLFVALALLIKIFFRRQYQLLDESRALNFELEKNKRDIERSQTVLVSVMKDVEKEKHETSNLNHQLHEKNNEMEQFIYTVSHDLKSPLVTIAGFTKKLLGELSEVLSEKQQYRFTRIIENAKNMEALLSDLLALSKIVQQEIKLEYVDAKQVINTQLLVLESAINETNANITIADNLRPIYVNERLFSQVILNLISNAIRYRDVSRPLQIDIFMSETDNTSTISVKDNGIGIDPKYHELIFGIFERLSAHEGTGVGLTIVRTVMDKHKGSIDLHSELNQGACFSLNFPKKKSANNR